MVKCPVCNLGEFDSSSVERTFAVDGCWILVRNIPAQVCDICGETTYGEAEAARLEQILAGHEQPIDSCLMPVFEFDVPYAARTTRPSRRPQRSHGTSAAKSTDAA